MNAQIITIGDEILIGQVIDTNSAWMASELTKLGFSISQIVSIPDNEKNIASSINEALKLNNLIVLTGGLGPTNDDITKHTLCSLFKTELEFNTAVHADIKKFLKQRGGKMNTLNRDQALFPKAAKLLRNRQGTAPGMWFEQNGKVVISLPGVPWEMKGIFNDEIADKATSFFELPNNFYQTVMITGIAEAQLALKLNNWENQLPASIKLAYLPSPGVIRLRLGIKGKNKKLLQETIEAEVKKLHKIIPEIIFSDTEVTLQEAIGKLLINSNKTLSIAESCTGGTIAQMITSIPGSSKYFKGSVVAYSNEIKSGMLAVDDKIIEKHGAVSKEVVELMAIGARKKLNTNYAIATSGVAGPGGGTDDKPVGLIWIAVSGLKGTISKKFMFGKERDINIKRSSIAALNMLRKVLIAESK